MPPTLIGYFPKQRSAPTSWMSSIGIRDVASASLCISSGPREWATAPKHNDWGLFNDPGSAWSVVKPEQRAEFRMHAYRLYHARFSRGREHPFEQPDLPVAPLDDSFGCLGWDVVSRGRTTFECSPLSCNLVATRIPTNAYCLLPDVFRACYLAETAELDGCEPGPSYIVEVWASGVRPSP